MRERSEDMENRIYGAGDVLSLYGWLGKSEEELGIDNEYIIAVTLCHEVEFEGTLFGQEANGSVIFRPVGADKVQTAETVYIYSHALGYDDCREKLTELYGEPEYENEEPYVESLGGCVITCCFRNGSNKIKLETASERDYIDVILKSGETI